MNTKQLGVVTMVLALDAALVFGVGLAMWSEPPTPAEEAVGKGLITLGSAVAVPALVLFFAWLRAMGYGDQPRTPEGPRNDWQDA